MIPVEEQSEPDTFHDRVREPGLAFLKQYPNPTSRQFKRRNYWRRAGRDLYDAYSAICAYSCHWIPTDTGSDTIEHFVPKSTEPSQAYEWRNYRLVCGRLNGRKGAKQDVLDPFKIVPETFVLDFPSLLVKPGQAAEEAQLQAVVEKTIRRLGLNHYETTHRARLGYVRAYCEKAVSLGFLETHAPFIAAELKRQGLVNSIAVVMGLES